MLPGGKGANQAVAAAKLGAEVVFVAKLGKDVFASKSLPLLAAREAVPLRPPNHAPFLPDPNGTDLTGFRRFF